MFQSPLSRWRERGVKKWPTTKSAIFFVLSYNNAHKIPPKATMQDRHLIVAGALNMFIAVAFGAFGAHALKQTLSTDMLVIWHTAANYQMIHALGLIAIGLLMPRFDQVLLKRAGITMLIGILIFSGSLYTLAISGIRIFGVITPIGGLAFLLAWAMLAWVTFSRES